MVRKDGAGVTSGGPGIPGLEPLFLSLLLLRVCASQNKSQQPLSLYTYEDWQVSNSAVASQGLKTAANICSF